MRISALYTQPQPTVSFEFFPPKTAEDEATLLRETVPALKRLGAAYISVTYGAGGGTRDSTLRIVNTIRREHGVEAMSHVTCVGSTRETMAAFLQETEKLGIENILALRGDPPKDQPTFQAPPGGFPYATELIRFVKARRHSFTIGGAFYPEGHVECPDKLLDWDRTVAKVEAGAEFLISQLFYDVNDFLDCEAYLRKKGVKVPLVPGVLPFLNAKQIKRFTSLCGAKLPDPLRKKIEELADDDESVRQLGVEVCTDISRQLLDHGVPGIHIYCLNRVPSSAELVRNLGLAKG